MAWILALVMMVCSTMTLRAQAPTFFVSADGTESLEFVSEDEVNIRRDGNGYLLAGRILMSKTTSQRLDARGLRVTVTDHGRSEVLYYKMGMQKLIAPSGKELLGQTEAPWEVAQPGLVTETKRVQSATNMKQLGLGLLMYTGDRGGHFPKADGVAGLQLLKNTKHVEMLPNKTYLNPRDTRKPAADNAPLTEATTSYAYIGAGLKDDNEWATGVPILVEKPTDDTWVNLLFIDGHVEGVAVEAKGVESAVKVFYTKGRGRNGVPAEVQADVLKRARAADAIEKAAAAKP